MSNVKSEGKTYLWWLFLGWVGAHRFYLGDKVGGRNMAIVFVLAVLPIPFVSLAARVWLLAWWILDGIGVPGAVAKANAALDAQDGQSEMEQGEGEGA